MTGCEAITGGAEVPAGVMAGAIPGAGANVNRTSSEAGSDVFASLLAAACAAAANVLPTEGRLAATPVETAETTVAGPTEGTGATAGVAAETGANTVGEVLPETLAADGQVWCTDRAGPSEAPETPGASQAGNVWLAAAPADLPAGPTGLSVPAAVSRGPATATAPAAADGGATPAGGAFPALGPEPGGAAATGEGQDAMGDAPQETTGSGIVAGTAGTAETANVESIGAGRSGPGGAAGLTPEGGGQVPGDLQGQAAPDAAGTDSVWVAGVTRTPPDGVEPVGSSADAGPKEAAPRGAVSGAGPGEGRPTRGAESAEGQAGADPADTARGVPLKEGAVGRTETAGDAPRPERGRAAERGLPVGDRPEEPGVRSEAPPVTQERPGRPAVGLDRTGAGGEAEPPGPRPTETGRDPGAGREGSQDRSGARPAEGEKTTRPVIDWAGESPRIEGSRTRSGEGGDPLRPNSRLELRELPQFVRRAEVVARAGGPTEMRVQLVPENLGRLSLRVSVTEGGVSARLVVENPEVKALVEQRLPELERALREQGLRLNGLSVGCDQAGTRSDGFLHEQVREGAWRGLGHGTARRQYEEQVPVATAGDPTEAVNQLWPGGGGLVNALV